MATQPPLEPGTITKPTSTTEPVTPLEQDKLSVETSAVATQPIPLPDLVKLQVDASKHLSTVAAAILGIASGTYAVVKSLPSPNYFLGCLFLFLISFSLSTFSLALPWWLADKALNSSPDVSIRKAKTFFAYGFGFLVGGVFLIMLGVCCNIGWLHA